MLQVKILKPEGTELETSINSFLATIEASTVKDIKLNGASAMILYEVKHPWECSLCCDCQYWDDGGSVESVSGLCQECGGRRRFNCKACSHFKDIRG